jgi:predicted nuclease of restriction endonuclease-like (RecB) superfamily
LKKWFVRWMSAAVPMMSKKRQPVPSVAPDELFGRVIAILDQARGNVVRAVNTNMVYAYWLIGREIVEGVQGGEERAAYGKKVVEDLSARLTERYGKGFSLPNIKRFRQFYQAFSDRGISSPLGSYLSHEKAPHWGSISEKRLPIGDKSLETPNQHPPGDELLLAFSPQLTWSHYRALMRVDKLEARDFYERETIEGGWDKRTLERQIQSFYYERMLKSAKPEKMLAEGRHLPVPASSPADALKNPYVLEFLGLPDVAVFHELDLERAIITHLQRFLLELGTGFAFVARQKQIRIEEQERYIDLVFYHCRLKFYLLIDLKVGELSHADVGQMDGYVRMFDGLVVAPDDNPTIGLILCTEKNETVARYSVLNDRQQIFASKYMLFLPTEEQLRLEIERERRLIESNLEDQADV